MEEEKNQFEFKYLLLSQLANYDELEKCLKDNDIDRAAKKITDYKNIIIETLNKN